ncbi:hypothetical protein LR48_Vigan10g239500 [Vigna angularis]|uniref:Uncharacterized protein n=1 Tax=Phaseolus angularis TaxID=3914 RepID=A0A0L9VNI0_PHAAN|nr:hypothetical protein LR48_Vigan10g239500 [Vigna angularis]
MQKKDREFKTAAKFCLRVANKLASECVCVCKVKVRDPNKLKRERCGVRWQRQRGATESFVRRKVVASAKLKALQEKLDATMKSNEELTLQVAEVEKVVANEKTKAKTLLGEARTITCQLQISNDDLKLDLQCSVLLDDPRFDIMKMVVEGKLVNVPLRNIPKTSTPIAPFAEPQPVVVENIEEAEGENA